MADLAVVSSALASIKTAMEIVKGLRDRDLVVEKAELKLRLADVVTSLADARTELVEIQETLSAKDARIAELEAAFQAKDQITRRGDAYYRLDVSGQPVGEPLCLRCWDVEHKQRWLIRDSADHRSRVCPVCHTKYEGRLVGAISPSPSPGAA